MTTRANERMAELKRMHGEILAELDGMAPAKLGTAWHADRCAAARALAGRIELLAGTAEAREIDRACNAARTADEMRDAVHARRLVRAGMSFDHAMAEFERSNPLPAAVLIDRHPIVIR